MGMEENRHACKRSRVNTGDVPVALIGLGDNHSYEDYAANEDMATAGDSNATIGGNNLGQWQHPSSRIFRVSRASGGKDRHSKVITSKGLRDRRVRLSVSTAIQFYDLQDRLGYDQPSKAIEWLINAASAAIAELPFLGNSFSEPPGPVRRLEDPILDIEADPVHEQQKQHLSLSKSGCSSTSETSKGSVLSLSRSEICVKTRERARSRAVKDKERDRNEHGGHHFASTSKLCQNMKQNLNSQKSFTELLTCTAAGCSSNDGITVTVPQLCASADSINKQIRHFPTAIITADYFGQQQSAFPSSQSHFLNSSPSVGVEPYYMAAAAAAVTAAGDHSEMQHFSFTQEHMDYNLNFPIAPGLDNFSRGTLQSNSSAHLVQQHLQLQRFPYSSSSMEGPNLPLIVGAMAAAPATASSAHNFCLGFGSRLQLNREPSASFLLDGYRTSDLEGKGKT